MSRVNEVMDDLEDELKVIMVDGEPKTIKEVLDTLLCRDTEQRIFSEG